VEIRRSALIAPPAASTFDVIEAAEHYPEFLPWCTGATILARDESVVAARLAVDYHGLCFALTTRNPKRRPHWMAIRLEDGPFRRFEGEWNIRELGATACKIEFALHYEFDSTLVGKLADAVFGRIAGTMIDAFAERADDVRRRGSDSAARSPPDSGDTP
jgi:ribosome-associated toxin RatA of RatAB toxin-antitoxin module